ncbi:helix-turn-helix domain-containing protein [Geodermatophilus sp. TF02-6]|uniref:helix-turn-helix domain-containing protein n=1 Tax=Geodermatophilus sp. TF02-6 TaxID=2250575 RepID=UPI0013146DEF|nr:helix-turn-helix domain-containing protein [Geodermatophilus sp. TF02-6]
MDEFDLPGLLRRIRRQADLSQRELAAACGISASTVSHAEGGRRGLPTHVLARAAELAGLRLALVDAEGRQVPGMDPGAVRDEGGRRFPAHLDTRYGDEDWWHGDSRYSRQQPWYTYDRLRYTRDHWRGRLGVPDDHQLPQPGDSPAARRARRQQAAWQRRQEEVRRRREAGELPERQEWTCTCPPLCDELDDGSRRPVHAPDCPCGCDLA